MRQLEWKTETETKGAYLQKKTKPIWYKSMRNFVMETLIMIRIKNLLLIN